MAVALTRTVEFRAVHRLYRPDWSEPRNRETFGPLSEAPGHAHDYRCAVTVSGPVDDRMGMVVDLAELDRILQEEVVTRRVRRFAWAGCWWNCLRSRRYWDFWR
jgi:6-pyruvoyltetrahydropterin/6-carboxytetrahydropterin synthase